MKLEKFNLEKALNGAKVFTRDGREVTQLTRFETDSHYCLYGVVNGFVKDWTSDGKYRLETPECSKDLFLEVKVRRAWVNVYGNGRDILTSGCYRTKQVALHNIREDYEYIKTVEITDEL
jgi:hypothetical protein